MSGLADRIKRSISERAYELGLPQRISRRRLYSDEEDNDSYGYGTDGASTGFSPLLSPPEPGWQRRGRRQQQQQQQQLRAAERTEKGGATATTGKAARLANDDAYRLVVDMPRVGAAAAAAAAPSAAHSVSPSFGRGNPRRSSGGGNGSGSGRRRGLGSIRRVSFDAADARSSAHDPARSWSASAGGDPAPAKPTSGAETLKNSSRWQHQLPLGGGGGGGRETGTGSNAPSLHALLASGEFYPAGGEIADGGKQTSPGRLPRAGPSFRWSGGRGAVELRDHNNNPSRFAENFEGWVAGDRSRPERDGGEEAEEEEKEREEGRAGVEVSAAQEDGSGRSADAAAAAAGITSTCAGGEDSAGGVAAETARAKEAPHLVRGNDDSVCGLSTSKDYAARHGDTTDVFSLGAGQKSDDSSSRSAGAADTCGGGVHGTAGDSGPRDGTPLESATPWSEGSLLRTTFSGEVQDGTMTAGKGGGDGQRGKDPDDLFPPAEGASAEAMGAGGAVATGEDRGKQRPALDDLLRDMSVAVPVEGPGEGDNAGGSIVAALSHRAELMDVVLA